MVYLKLKKSLAKENFCNQLIIKGSCQVKEIVDYENQKINPQDLTKNKINSRSNEFYRKKNSRK